MSLFASFPSDMSAVTSTISFPLFVNRIYLSSKGEASPKPLTNGVPSFSIIVVTISDKSAISIHEAGEP